MRLSFDDEESFKEGFESLRFDSSGPNSNTCQQLGSTSSMPLEYSKSNEDNIVPSDPITTLRRVGSSSSLSIQEIWRSEDIHVSFDNLQSTGNPELEFTLASGPRRL